MLERFLEAYDAVLVLDTETTGISCRNDEIIELAVLKAGQADGALCEPETMDEFIRLSEGRRLPDKIVELTGITEQMLLDDGIEKRLAAERFAAPVWYAALGGASLFLREWLNPVSIGFLFPLGLVAPGFFSADYFPLFPWLFVFLMGTYLGGPMKAGRFPAFFYKISPGFFGAVGRHALIVYLLHQPVLFCLAKCLARFIPFS